MALQHKSHLTILCQRFEIIGVNIVNNHLLMTCTNYIYKTFSLG